MSLGRWTATTAGMTGAAWVLVVLGPTRGQAERALAAPQALVDAAGVDALLVPFVAAAGWACWAWGVLGLTLTALSSLPGTAGRGADLLLAALLPAGARRLAAIALGLTVSTTTPLPASPAALAETPATVALTTAADQRPVPDGGSLLAATGASVLDWPGAAAGDTSTRAADGGPADGAPPDWPGDAAATADQHVVVRGDCLWDIAAPWLEQRRPGAQVSDTDVLAAVHAWWQTNAAVIGPDPDLLLPGQVLSAPRPAPPG